MTHTAISLWLTGIIFCRPLQEYRLTEHSGHTAQYATRNDCNRWWSDPLNVSYCTVTYRITSLDHRRQFFIVGTGTWHMAQAHIKLVRSPPVYITTVSYSNSTTTRFMVCRALHSTVKCTHIIYRRMIAHQVQNLRIPTVLTGCQPS